MLAHDIGVFSVGNDQDVLQVKQRLDALHADLQQRAPAEQVDNLFGFVFSAQGP